MLIRLREAVKSWVAMVFIALLAFSFAVWGLADVFVGRTSESLVSVGKRHVFPVDLDRALDRWISRQAAQGARTSRTEAVQSGTLQTILTQMVGETVLLGYADKSGISASPQAAANEIQNAPIFRDPLKGGFDRSAYREYLSQIRMSPEAFETELRDSLTYNFLVETPALGFRSADILAQIWALHVGENRKIAFVSITGSDVPDPEDPDDSDLQAWLDSHVDDWRVPERRALAILEISAEDFMDRVRLDDAEIEDAYVRQIRAFSEAETRTLVFLSSAERQPLQALVDQLSGGTSLDAALEAAGDTIHSEEDTVRADEIDEEAPQIAQAFALGFGQAMTPFPDPEDETRWVSLAVRDIKPGKTRPLAEVAEELSDSLRRRKAEEILYEERERLYDLVGGGASLQEIAAQMGGVVRTLAPIDRRGLTRSSAVIEALNPWPGAMEAAFKLGLRATSDLIENDQGVLLMSAEEIILSHLPELDEIRALLAHDWRKAKRAGIIDGIATALEQASTFEALQQAAQGFDLTAHRYEQPLNRYSQSDNLEDKLIRAVFETDPGKMVRVTRRDGSQIMVLVEDVIPGSLATDDNPILQNGREAVSSGLLRDIQFAFRKEVEAGLDLELNNDRIESYIQTLTGQP